MRLLSTATSFVYIRTIAYNTNIKREKNKDTKRVEGKALTNRRRGKRNFPMTLVGAWARRVSLKTTEFGKTRENSSGNSEHFPASEWKIFSICARLAKWLKWFTIVPTFRL